MNILKLMRIRGIRRIEIHHIQPIYIHHDYEESRNRDLEEVVEIINRHLKNNKDIHKTQEELIDSGFEKWANI